MDINLNGNTLINGYFAGIVVSPDTTKGKWFVKSSSYTASVGDKIQADTSGRAFTITLPPSASIGATIRIQDAKLSWNIHNLTIARNGLKINGTSSNFIADEVGGKLLIVYVSTSFGWSIK